ncbi:putative reverse transcriptase zinc-binding domain-containing protein [Helianthus annuus]|nr:putative reverse transcriptase zinc-binding domain-containing protein [Helianthus annuus]
MGRIPTVDALLKRNCYNGEDMCVLCEERPETADHLFCSCYVAAVLWNRVSLWFKISPIYAFLVKDLLEIYKYAGLKKHEEDIMHGIIMVGCWILWKRRNDIRFSGISVDIALQVVFMTPLAPVRGSISPILTMAAAVRSDANLLRLLSYTHTHNAIS